MADPVHLGTSKYKKMGLAWSATVRELDLPQQNPPPSQPIIQQNVIAKFTEPTVLINIAGLRLAHESYLKTVKSELYRLLSFFDYHFDTRPCDYKIECEQFGPNDVAASPSCYDKLHLKFLCGAMRLTNSQQHLFTSFEPLTGLIDSFQQHKVLFGNLTLLDDITVPVKFDFETNLFQIVHARVKNIQAIIKILTAAKVSQSYIDEVKQFTGCSNTYACVITRLEYSLAMHSENVKFGTFSFTCPRHVLVFPQFNFQELQTPMAIFENNECSIFGYTGANSSGFKVLKNCATGTINIVNCNAMSVAYARKFCSSLMSNVSFSGLFGTCHPFFDSLLLMPSSVAVDYTSSSESPPVAYYSSERVFAKLHTAIGNHLKISFDNFSSNIHLCYTFAKTNWHLKKNGRMKPLFCHVKFIDILETFGIRIGGSVDKKLFSNQYVAVSTHSWFDTHLKFLHLALHIQGDTKQITVRACYNYPRIQFETDDEQFVNLDLQLVIEPKSDFVVVHDMGTKFKHSKGNVIVQFTSCD